MILPLLFLLSSFSLLANTLNLEYDDIPNLIKVDNQHVKAAELRKESAETRQKYFERSFLPKLEGSLGVENFKTGTQANRTDPYGEISFKMNLYRGGRDRLENRLINTEMQAASFESESTFRAEIKKARINFWNLVSLQEIFNLTEKAILKNKKNLLMVESRVRAGVSIETDKIEFEMYDFELEQELARLKILRRNIERDLAILLGFKDDVAITTITEVNHKHTDELLRRDLNIKSSPIIKSLYLKSDEAEIKAAQVSKWWIPTLDLYGSNGVYTFREKEFESAGNRREMVVGLNLTMELYDGGTSRIDRQYKTLQSHALKKEAEQSYLELNSKIEGAKAELVFNHELIHQTEKIVGKAETYLNRTLEEYKRGVKNSPDVLAALEKNLAILKKFAELRHDYQLARIELLEIVGD